MYTNQNNHRYKGNIIQNDKNYQNVKDDKNDKNYIRYIEQNNDKEKISSSINLI